jgi:hypothetical protein
MKTYIAILVGVVVLFAVVFGGYKFISKASVKGAAVSMTSHARMMKVTGEVKRVYEGEHMITYSFDIPEAASSTSDMEGGLIKVIGAAGTQAAVYFSYEGGRGYSPVDYLTDVVAPHVAVIDLTGTSTIGAYTWTMAESAGSEWFVAPSADKQWLIVVEAKKAMHDDTEQLLTSMTLK